MASAVLCATVLLNLVSLLCTAQGLDVHVAEPKGFSKQSTWGQSTLYRVNAETDYQSNPLLIHLVGSRYNIGYAYGYLLSKEIDLAYHSLFASILGDQWYDEVLLAIIEKLLDWQWDSYLSKQLPSEYQRELEGLADGSKANGCADCGKYSTRAITMANAPGDLKDFLFILMREFGIDSSVVWEWVRETERRKREEGHGLQCSMFAVWGSRTQGAQLFSARNLDWNKDTGINKNKLVMVVVPDDGSAPSVTLGFVGLYGTLAGMSGVGLTTHEANLEEDEITFGGFPWTLRLRYIMEFAKDLHEARQLWASTNNTVGFNHMVASAPDAVAYRQGQNTTVAVAMETMFQYTAYFADNDPREAAATYTPSGGGTPVHIGFPMHEAVWRTNHGYDPTIREHYEWSQAPSSWSMQRYMFIHDALVNYHQENKTIGYMEALNITAIAGDKGQHAYTCENNTDGTNVLSVTFQPEEHVVYTAWERSSAANWRPATCSTYIKLNMTEWFKPTPPY